MPALSPSLASGALQGRDSVSNNSSHTGSNNLQVICAWPVSGQYGPGVRVLYYVLVAACILARKEKWLRNACLAAALLFPAIAALHGIVLASVHVDDAVDMDVYGAFQLCSIGVLAALVTVKVSRTYFDDLGRNTVFVWSSLILAGLLSLTVEFFRIKTHTCTHDDFGNAISPDASFPYGHATCGLTCSVTEGPFSPIRGGSGNNIYVIPVPSKLDFNTATLISAACCIPAILLMLSMWLKVLEKNWEARFVQGDEAETIGKMKPAGPVLRLFREYLEIPVFGSAVLAVLIVGESNLFSRQVDYQTEPMANIGQWAPIAATGLALLGSLFLLFAEAMNEEDEREQDVELQNTEGDPSNAANQDIKRKVTRVLVRFIKYLATPARRRFDVTEFRHGRATNYPQIPGEELRNRDLSQIRSNYDQHRNSHDSTRSGIRRQHSNGPSLSGSFAAQFGAEDSSTTPRASSPRRRRSTLDVPTSPRHRPAIRSSQPAPDMDEVSPIITTPESAYFPAIVVSSSPDAVSPAQTPVLHTPAPRSDFEPRLSSPSVARHPP